MNVQSRSSTKGFYYYLTTVKDVVFSVQAWLGLALFIALTVVVFMQVTTRYIFHNPYLWTEEVARYLLLWVTMMGAALSAQTQRHFIIEFYDYKRIKNSSLRKVLRLIPHVAFASLALIMVISGIEYTIMSGARMGRLSNINMKYVFMSIPVSGATILLYCIHHLATIILSKDEGDTHIQSTERAG